MNSLFQLVNKFSFFSCLLCLSMQVLGFQSSILVIQSIQQADVLSYNSDLSEGYRILIFQKEGA
jgi:hypothetical protein